MMERGEIKMLNKKIIFISFILFFSTVLNGMKLSELKSIKNLSNYNEVKDIEVERVVNYNNYERNKEKDRVYVNGETMPFTGVGIKKNNDKIIGITIYKNGRSEGFHYRYFDNGQLYMKIQQQNDKSEGEGYEYYKNGKLKCKIQYQNDIEIYRECFQQDGKLHRIYKQKDGKNGIITGYYENGIKNSVLSVTQDYSIRGEINYIKNGKTLVYDKKGVLFADLNYKNDSIIGLQQKFYVNGKLKYDLIAASEDPKNFKAMDYAIEYYDNSDIIKLDCREKERGKGKWTCKEYNKNGSFKREFDSPTYKFKQSGTKDWINYLLPVLKLLTGW